jgi:hypothetical protein
MHVVHGVPVDERSNQTGKQKGRISIIYYSILNPINPALQPAVSADLP